MIHHATSHTKWPFVVQYNYYNGDIWFTGFSFIYNNLVMGGTPVGIFKIKYK